MIKKNTFILIMLTWILGNIFSPLLASPVKLATKSTSSIIPSLAPMLEKVMPSVVSISVEGSTKDSELNVLPGFQNFFGKESPFCKKGSPLKNSPFCGKYGSGSNNDIPRKKILSLGSGVIVNSKKGYIVTNSHVVNRAKKINIKLNDGRKFSGKIIGEDLRSDIALIKIKSPNNLQSIKLADSDKLRVGDYSLAIGNPFGLGQTVTYGIISALSRSGLNVENYENFIQTDAAINRGNSGGALVDLEGKLIGINTAILAPDGGNIGIGFAIPSNMVKNLVQQIVRYGKVRRGELGIIGTELNSEIAKAMNINAQKGAFVSQVIPYSPAEKCGIHPGDVIISLDKKSVNSFSVLRAQIASIPVGRKIRLGLLRKKKKVIVYLKLQESNQIATDSDIFDGIDGARIVNSKDKKGGVVVSSAVRRNSLAMRIGLRKGDIIIGINQKEVKNIKDIMRIFKNKSRVLALSILRGNAHIYLFLQ